MSDSEVISLKTELLDQDDEYLSLCSQISLAKSESNSHIEFFFKTIHIIINSRNLKLY